MLGNKTKNKKKKTKKRGKKLQIWTYGASNIAVIRRRSQIGAAVEIGGEAGGDGGVVHGVVKRLRFHGLQPELPRLLLREATRGVPGTRRLPVEIRARFVLRLLGAVSDLLFSSGINVVGLRRPPEERGPPVGGGNGFAGVRVGSPVTRNSTRTDPVRSEGDEIRSHLKSLSDKQSYRFFFRKSERVVRGRDREFEEKEKG
jgi:hypothetical protein